MDPYVFDLLHRERLREQVADFHLRQWRGQESKARRGSRGSVGVLLDRIGTRFAQVLGSASEPTLTAPLTAVARSPRHGRDE